MSRYQEVLDEFDGYEEYQQNFQIYIDKMNEKKLRKIYNINNYIIKKYEYHAKIEKMGEPIYYTRKMTFFRLSGFLGALLCAIFTYFELLLFPLIIISDVDKFFNDGLIDFLIGIVMGILIFLSIYYLSLTAITSLNINDLLSKNKNMKKTLLFPFNKITINTLAIHIIIGKKEVFMYSTNYSMRQTYSYKYHRYSIQSSKMWKLLNKTEHQMIMNLSKNNI